MRRFCWLELELSYRQVVLATSLYQVTQEKINTLVISLLSRHRFSFFCAHISLLLFYKHTYFCHVFVSFLCLHYYMALWILKIMHCYIYTCLAHIIDCIYIYSVYIKIIYMTLLSVWICRHWNVKIRSCG